MKGCVNMPLPQHKAYTIEDIFSLPEGTRAELIDGQIYYMAPPSRKHQQIAGNYSLPSHIILTVMVVPASHISLLSLSS